MKIWQLLKGATFLAGWKNMMVRCECDWPAFCITYVMNTTSFPLNLDYEGEHFAGTIEPSAELDGHGVPVHFRVIIDGKLFAYLCCGSNGWGDDGSHPKNLINAIGQYITEWYE